MKTLVFKTDLHKTPHSFLVQKRFGMEGEKPFRSSESSEELEKEELEQKTF